MSILYIVCRGNFVDCAAQNYNNTTKAFLHCIVCSAYLHHSSFLQQLKYTGNKHHHFVEHWCTTIEQWHYSTNIDSRVCDVNYFWSALLQQNHNYYSWPDPRANVNSDTLKAVITFNRLRWLKQFWGTFENQPTRLTGSHEWCTSVMCHSGPISATKGGVSHWLALMKNTENTFLVLCFHFCICIHHPVPQQSNHIDNKDN